MRIGKKKSALLGGLLLALLLSGRQAGAAGAYYYTYSVFETGQNNLYRNGFAHLYAIQNNTDCFLYRSSDSNSMLDIGGGTVYSSLGMVDGQPFDPAIVDAPGPGFGNSYFMLKSSRPMLWEMGSDIVSTTLNQENFVLSDNATFRGRRFFTYLNADQSTSGPTSKGDLLTFHNPNPVPVTVTLSRWTGIAGNYTPLVTQVIDPYSAWESGGSMPWEIPGVQGTDLSHQTHYRVTSDQDIMVGRGNFFDSDNDSGWSSVPAWDTGSKIGTEFYGYTGNHGPELPIAITDASGAANGFQLYYYSPTAPLAGNYLIGPGASGVWTATGSVNPVPANGTVALNPAPSQTLFKVVCSASAQAQLGYRIGGNTPASTADWFGGMSGDHGALNTSFRFRSGDQNWISCIAPIAGTSVTLQRVSDACTHITGTGSSLAGGGPLTPISPVNLSTLVTGVANQPISWKLGNLCGAGQYTLTASQPVYMFAGQVGGDKYYSGPVPRVIFSQLDMQKSVNKLTARPNDLLTYSMTYSNTGSGVLTLPGIWDTIPANTSYVPGSISSSPPAASSGLFGNLLSWNFASVGPGASGTLSFVVRVDAAAPTGTSISNVLSGQDDGTYMPAPAKSNIVNTYVAPQIVSISLSNNPAGSISAGTPINYTLTYSNTGSSVATNVFVCDTIPAGSTINGSPSSSPFFTYSLVGNLLCWNIGSLQPQYTATSVTVPANVVLTSTSMTTAANVFTCSDSLRATNTTPGGNAYEVVSFTPTTFPGGAIITSVVVEARWWSTLYHHNLGLAFTTDGTNPQSPAIIHDPVSNALPGALSSWDITSLRSWTPALFNAIRLQASFLYSGGGTDTGNLDCIRLIVNYLLPSGLTYSGSLDFQVIPNTCMSNITNTASESDNQSSGSLSNSVSNGFLSCPSNTPSPTLTRSPTASPTPTRSFSSSPTRSPTPSASPTPVPLVCPSGPPAAAYAALGQSSLIANVPNSGGLSASSLNIPFGLAGDAIALAVADLNNNRVVLHLDAPLSMNQPADVVLGQPSFGSSGSGMGLNQMYNPGGLALDAAGTLWVADMQNQRILKFNNAFSLSSGATADGTLGITNSIACSASQLNTPFSLFMLGSDLLIVDTYNNRVVVHLNAASKANGAAANFAIGQVNLFSCSSGTSAGSMNLPKAAVFGGGKLFIADSGNHRVLVYNSMPVASGAAADLVIGQANFSGVLPNQGGSPSASSLSNPSGLYFDEGRLYIMDTGNNRVLVYNSVPVASGASADAVLGQTIFTAGSASSSSIGMSAPIGMQRVGNVHYISEQNNNRVAMRSCGPIGTATPSQTPTPCVLNVSGSMTLTAGSYNFCDVHVFPGGTLFIQGLVQLNLSGNLTLDSGSQINGLGGSNLGGTGAADGVPGNSGGGGGGYGGAGGAGGGGPLGGGQRSSPNNPNLQGERGGNSDSLGGKGGAMLWVIASSGNALLNGGINVSAMPGTDYINPNSGAGGGGSGGGVNIQALNISGSADIYAQGADGGQSGGFNAYGGGGGGGGRVQLCASGSNTYVGLVYVDGGYGGFGGTNVGQDGQLGSYYFCSAPWAPSPTTSPTPSQSRTPSVSPSFTPSPCTYLMSQLGSTGSGSNQYNQPLDMAAANSNVYLTDALNNRIVVLQLDGTELGPMGGPGSGNGQYNTPVGIATEGSHFYVADMGNHRVQKISLAGSYTAQWGSLGSANGQFNQPYAIAVRNGEVFVSELTGNRIQVFDINGTYLRTFGLGTQWFGLAVDANVVYATNGSSVTLFDLNGNVVGGWGSFGSGPGQFSGAQSLDVYPGTGILYVADTGNNRIQIFNVQGTLLGIIPVNSPRGVAYHISQQLYVSSLQAGLHHWERWQLCPSLLVTTPTFMPSPTYSATPSASPSPSKTRTPTVSPSASPSNSPSATASPSPSASPTPASLSAWGFYRTMDVNNVTSANLVNHPVLVKCGFDSTFFSNCRIDAADLRFTDPSGTVQYDFQLARWNQGAQQIEAWVKLPSLPVSSITSFRVYYGNPSASAYASGPVWVNGQVGVWHFEEGSGSSSIDSSPFGNTATLYNGPTWQSSSQIFTGLLFNGLEWAGAANSASLNSITTDLTMMAWVKPTASGTQYIISRYQTSERYALYLGTGTNNVFVNINGTVVGPGAAVNFNWHHVGATYGSGTARIYMDGVQGGSSPATPFGATTAGLGIGARDTSGGFQMSSDMDEARIYNRALTGAEMDAEYRNQSCSWISVGGAVSQFSPTPSSSPTPTRSPTPTQSPSPSPTLSSTTTRTVSPTPSVTASITPGGACASSDPFNSSIPFGSLWTILNIGSASSSSNSEGLALSMTTASNGVWSTADSCYYAYQAASGDIDVTLRLGCVPNTLTTAGMGLMVRNSTAPGSASFAVFKGPNNFFNYYRLSDFATTSGSSAAAPPNCTQAWVRIIRQGNLFTSRYSTDGSLWTFLDSQTMAMNNSYVVGVFVDSANGASGSGVANDFNIISQGCSPYTATPSRTQSPSVTPSPSVTATPCALVVNGGSFNLPAGTYSYCSVLVTGGGTLFVNGAVVLNVGSFQVDAGSQVNGAGLGFAGGAVNSAGAGPGGGLSASLGGGGGGHGSLGGDGGANPASGGAAYDSPLAPVQAGSGGAGGGNGSVLGGAGGAALLISATGNVILDGNVTLIGGTSASLASANFFSLGGGGAGGSLWVLAPNISGGGILNVAGGGGGGVNTCTGNCRTGGGGSGGMINLCAGSSNTFSGAAGFGGGFAGLNGDLPGQNGGAGSYYFCGANQVPSPTPSRTATCTATPTRSPTVTPSPSPTASPSVSVTPCALVVNATSLTLTAGSYSYCSVLVTGNASLFIQGAVTFDVGNFQVDAGSQVIGDGRGLVGGALSSSGVGPGGGGAGGAQGAGGGGHAGLGGAGGLGVNGGLPYDNPANPLLEGSGGGGGNLGPGSAGGAALFISATGSVTLNGLISMNGSSPVNVSGGGTDAAAGAGAAGSINIRALNIGGSGALLRVDGGNGGGFSSCGTACYGGGGGSGGIINICVSGTYSLSSGFQFFGGNGGSGTVPGLGGTPGLLYLCAVNQVSPTPSSTPSPSKTASSTASPSASPSPTLTPSFTPSVSPSPSATATATRSASTTLTLTLTLTSTLTATQTQTPTASPSASASQTSTPSITPSQTPSISPTNSETRTASVTATSSRTASETVTQSFSPTQSLTPTPSLTPSFSATFTETRTVSASVTASPTASASASVTPSRTASATLTPPNSPTPTQSVTATRTGTPFVSPTSSYTITPTFSISNTPMPTGTAEVPVVTSKNVFNPEKGGTIDINMKAPSGGVVTVKVYNIAGDLVRPIFEAEVQAGLWFQASWNGKNEGGDTVAAGVYFVSVKGAGIKTIRKVVVMK